MQTLTFECEVDVNRDLVLRLPPTVTPGRHRISLLIDPPEQPPAERGITPIADGAPPQTALWARLQALREQAERQGELGAPMSADEILAEVARRRGDTDD